MFDFGKKMADKPVNNHIVISDKKAAEWFLTESSRPVTAERILHTKNHLSRFEEHFFNA